MLVDRSLKKAEPGSEYRPRCIFLVFSFSYRNLHPRRCLKVKDGQEQDTAFEKVTHYVVVQVIFWCGSNFLVNHRPLWYFVCHSLQLRTHILNKKRTHIHIHRQHAAFLVDFSKIHTLLIAVLDMQATNRLTERQSTVTRSSSRLTRRRTPRNKTMLNIV